MKVTEERTTIDPDDAHAARALHARTSRRAISLAITLLALGSFIFTTIARTRSNTAPEPETTQGANQEYSNFSHRSARHASLSCAACHRRGADNSARPSLPGHKDCTDCHLAQFVTPNIQMCVICHTNVSGPEAPLKNFPEHFSESFNVKFDHAQHMEGQARPAQGCAFCHERPLRRGVGWSIPAGLDAHTQCYTCHTPNRQASSGIDLGSCSTCHALAPYSRTQTNARAFRAGFSHADHSARQRLGCADCHSLTPDLPQSRQVSAPATAQHFAVRQAMSCMTCHNGKRAFGGDLQFADCRRCHKGPTFRLPA